MDSAIFLVVAIFGVGMGWIGLARGKLVGLFPCRRSENPVFFWYGIMTQLLLGAVCLVLAIVKLFP